MYPLLPRLDWGSLPGGENETSSWFTARDRKLSKAAELAQSVIPLARRLEWADALFECSVDILRSEPAAARWYLDLTGLTRKLISRLRDDLEQFNLKLSPETIAINLADGRRVAHDDLERFADWINTELDALYPRSSRTLDLALSTVLAMNGARIQGQVQNAAGDDAVLLLKRLLIGEMARRGISVEVMLNGIWVEYTPAYNLLEQRHLRFGERLVCEFVPGGNRPDLKIMRDGVVVLVAEVKGRSDLSNLWESWMPQINGHLQTWVADNPQAPRVFFGTIITREMIEGLTRGGTRQTGLRAFHRNGLLTGAYNLSNIAEGQPGAERAFEGFVTALCDAAEL